LHSLTGKMSRARLVFIHLLIIGVTGGSLYDIVTRQEHWPFSNYPMFSTIHREAVLRWPRIYGVRPDGREEPVTRYADLWPLDQSRLPLGLRAIYDEEGASQRVRDALADVLQRYEARRQTGEHEGGPFVAMRLYMVSWPLEPFAANLDQPSKRQLLAEASVE
jgi:hypothetical protein